MSEQLTLHHFSFAELHLDGPAPARDLFAHLQAQPWAMLLESASEQHPDSRFDIISADPVATVVTDGAETCIEYPGTERPALVSTDDPLQLLQQTSNALLGIRPYAGELPFIGGAIGLFGYDLGRRFERLPVLSQADITVPDMAQGIYDWAWILDKARRQATLLVLGDETAWQQRWLWWQQQQRASLTPCRLTTPWQANMDEAGYRQRFARIQAYLAAGDCYQINLTQRFCAGYEGSEWEAYCRLSSGNAAPFSAFLRLPHAAILSLSPERFLCLEGTRVSTKPIKGTRPRHREATADAAAAEALRHADKDRAENLMIVDLLRNDIGRVCIPGTVRVPSLFAIESFPAVHHLVSTIEGELPSTLSATDLLRACFPGGSITGAPKIRAMEIIEELEPQRRNAYCGSIGYLSCDGRMDTSITIRTLIACQQTLYVWAGGGIVADSQVEAEYQETYDKLGRILPLLANDA